MIASHRSHTLLLRIPALPISRRLLSRRSSRAAGVGVIVPLHVTPRLGSLADDAQMRLHGVAYVAAAEMCLRCAA